jgi:hypothetical protein
LTAGALRRHILHMFAWLRQSPLRPLLAALYALALLVAGLSHGRAVAETALLGTLTLCLSPAHITSDLPLPAEPHAHGPQDCCILCAPPGLAAAPPPLATPPAVAAPAPISIALPAPQGPGARLRPPARGPPDLA